MSKKYEIKVTICRGICFQVKDTCVLFMSNNADDDDEDDDNDHHHHHHLNITKIVIELILGRLKLQHEQ